MSCNHLTARRIKAALVPDSLVYLGVVLFTAKVELSMQDLFPVPELLDNGLAAAAVLVMLFCAVKDWSSPRELALCAMGLGIIALAAARTGIYHLLITSVTVLALRGRNVQKAVKLIFNWKCLFFLLFLVLALVLDRTGVRSLWMHNPDMRRLLFGESQVLLRLGYRHYTAPGGVVFALTQLWCYLHFGSIKKRQLLALLAVQLAIFQLTSARMPLLMTIFLVALVYIYQNRTARKNPLLHTAAAAAPLALFAVFLVILVNCRNWGPVIWKLDSIMSTRLAQPAVWYCYRGLSLFGGSIRGLQPDGSAFHVAQVGQLDNLYLMMMVWQGIAPFLVVALCVFFLARQRNAAVNVMLLSWAVAGIAESDGLNCYMAFPLILTALAIPRPEKKTPWGTERNSQFYVE